MTTKHLPKIAILFASCAIFSSCAAVARIPFPETEYAALPKMGTGTGTIHGNTFLTQRGGGVVVGAGRIVTLNPVTSYSQQWATETLAGHKLAPVDSRIMPYVATTVANSRGDFTFQNIPAGEYFISAEITWEVQENRYGLIPPEGCLIIDKVRVKEGEVKDFILTAGRTGGR